MCFLPKIRASIDHAPGPIIAIVALSVANMAAINGSWMPVRMTQSSATVATIPAMGVHKPARRKIPAAAPVISGMMDIV